MRWWCFAEQGAWSWRWQAYPGVWLFVIGLLAFYLWSRRGWASGSTEPGAVREGRLRVLAYVTGVVLVWGALDWPMGPLGAGYLVSVHTSQFLLCGVVAPAFLLMGFPEHAYRALESRPRLHRALEHLTHPIGAFMIFNGVMTATHWPSIVDRMMATQAGSFVLDMGWLVAGLIFWWPVLAPVPRRPRFHPLAKLGYLGLNAFLIRPPFAIMIFSQYPAYRLYELAPPIGGRDPLADQQLAGVLMKVGTAWIMAIAAGLIFYRWYLQEREEPATG